MLWQSLVEHRDRSESEPADRDIERLTYSTDDRKLSLKYHYDSRRIAFATRQYFKLAHDEEGGDDVEWKTEHHAAFHVGRFFLQ